MNEKPQHLSEAAEVQGEFNFGPDEGYRDYPASTLASGSCPHCGGTIQLDMQDIRQERHDYIWVCLNCKTSYFNQVWHQIQSHDVLSDKWYDEEGNELVDRIDEAQQQADFPFMTKHITMKKGRLRCPCGWNKGYESWTNEQDWQNQNWAKCPGCNRILDYSKHNKNIALIYKNEQDIPNQPEIEVTLTGFSMYEAQRQGEFEFEASKLSALAKFLGVDKDEITEMGGVDFSIGREEYLVLTDEEADELAEAEIKNTLWAFNAEFIINECRLDNTGIPCIRAFQEEASENANDFLESLITRTIGMTSFTHSAISSDGRGHFLSRYDGEENEVDGFYIYRNN